MFGGELRNFLRRKKPEPQRPAPAEDVEATGEARLNIDIEMAADNIIHELKAKGITKEKYYTFKQQEQEAVDWQGTSSFDLLPLMLRPMEEMNFQGLPSAKVAKRLQQAVERKLGQT